MSSTGINSSINSDGNKTDNMIESDDEHDLTSLTWLMELRNQNFSWPNVIHPVSLDDDDRGNHKGIEITNNNKQQESNNNAIMEQENNFINNDNTETNNGYMVKRSCNKIIALGIDHERNVGSINNECTSKISKRSWFGSKTCIEKSCKKPIISLQSQQRKLQMKRATPTERFEIFLEKIKRVLAEYERSAMIYQTNSTEKPPFNYSHIIGMVMLENGRVTLQQICSWIEKKFAFFRVRKKWNNSIRHNLSLHQCFRKIDRTKFEKGKGGYWELGIDPRKCDRKRIRNRKGAHYRNRQLQLQQQQQKQQKTTIITNGTQATANKQAKDLTLAPLDELSRLPIESYYHIEHSTSSNMRSDCPDVITGNISYTEITDLAREKHLLVDESNIQDNIDVVSCCQHTQVQQDQDIYFSNILQCNSTENTPVSFQSIPNDDSQLHTIELLQNNQLQQQQYQLGTIIISTAAAKIRNISNFAATAESINCFINDEYLNEKKTELYINADETVIVSSYLDIDGAGNDKFTKVQSKSQSHIQQSNRVMNFNSNVMINNTLASAVSYPTMATLTATKSVSTALINSVGSDKKNLVPQSLRSNDIVDHIVRATPHLIKSTALTQVATDAHNDNNLDAQPHNHQVMTIDNIRPYIDGIEEAFQYLRSMDNNREDLLDNFLDISVSDY